MNGQYARWCRTLSVLMLAALFAALPLVAQQLTATLSGDVYDTSGGLVSNAKLTLTNQASGDVRTATTNSAGHFSITAIPPGSYSIVISANGFKKWQENNVALNQGDSRILNGVKLEVGQVSESVEVSGTALSVPISNGEISTTISTRTIEDTPLQGRDAGELLKIMPGMAFTNGMSQGSSFNDQVTGTNNGPVGAFSANGTQPNGAVSFMLDGANLVDPGNMGTQIANINQDMVSQIKVLTNDYDAEYAKGPTIFQAYSKSGGTQFHGEGYWYVRDNALDSVDAYLKATGGNNLQYRYNYLGGNVGGPVLLPFTSFNRDRKKMFFWGGYENMRQVIPGVAAGEGFPLFMNVPTAEQLSGEIYDASLPQGLFSQWGYAYGSMYNPPAGTVSTYTTNAQGQQVLQTQTIPQSALDPNILGIMKLFDKGGPWAPNVTPSAANNWNNFEYDAFAPQNRWEATGKIDYSFNDNNKLSVSFTRQNETDNHAVGVWWTPPWTLPYPGAVTAPTTSTVIMSNYTHVFSPTTTNEFVFTFARYINPNQLGNPSGVGRSSLGFNVSGLFGHTTKQIPDIGGVWGGNFPYITNFSFDNGFGGGSQFGGLKRDPALYDNFTKVIGAHTLKAGAYWDTSENIQSQTGLQNGDNGSYNLGWGPGDTGNVVADFFTGSGFANYQQQSSAWVEDLKFHQWAVYAQDSFQANRQLTLNYGLRLDHVGQWYGPSAGLQVWNPAAYNNSPNAAANTGLEWHALNSNIPLSGLKSRLFYPEPRVSLAYDVFGTGKSVIRAGWAMFRYQVSTEVSNAAGGPQGSFVYQTPGFSGGYGAISQFTPPSSVAQNGATIYAVEMGDDEAPLVTDWNVTWSQAMPWRSVLDISYIGNKSQNTWIDGTNGNLNNLNNRIPGSFWFPDPKGGALLSPGPPPCADVTKNPDGQSIYCQNNANYNTPLSGGKVFDYAPLKNYQNVYLISNAGYANYNSLQVQWQKSSGPLFFLANYTYSKVLGIWDWTSNNGPAGGDSVDPYNIKANYGPLAYDHTHILNFTYSWNTPSPIQNHLLGEAVNGWTLAGYTTYQSGAPLEPNTELNVTWPGNLTVPTVGIPNLPDNSFALPNGLRAVSVNPSTWLGTDSPHALLPEVVCDPRKNLASGYYFNPNCFAPPPYGQQGTLIWPYIKGPAYVNSDLSIFKRFRITEGKSFELRLQANNWLNHPLPQFGLAGTGDEQLNFTQTTPEMFTDTAMKQQTVQVISLAQRNTNPLTTGKPLYKTGSRLITAALKFYF